MKPQFDAIIFDIDNVLIDTRTSYLDAIRWTVEIYLTGGKVPLFVTSQKERKPHFLTLKDVDLFKSLGGFNDDWDCCYGMLTYLLSLPVEGRSLQALMKKMDFESFAASVKTRPLGVNGIVKLLGRSPSVMIEKISRIFQEVYLGKDLFETVEKKRLSYWTKQGLIHREKLIFKAPILKKLKAAGLKLGIATGRPRFEALYALKYFSIFDYFSAVITMDEVKKAEREKCQSLRKPHPFSLLESANRLGKGLRFAYVGDLPDDVLAAKQAAKSIDIRAIAYPWRSSHPEVSLAELKKVDPDFILRRPSQLLSVALHPRAKKK